MHTKALDKKENFRSRMPFVYDYLQENSLEWPASACKWGSVVEKNNDYIKQELYFSCRTDATYNPITNSWKKLGSYLVIASINIPLCQKRFNEELNSLFLQHSFKKCPVLEAKTMLIHPGEINAIKTSQVDKQWFATTSDSNVINVWNCYKARGYNIDAIASSEYPANSPCLILQGSKSWIIYALNWGNESSNIVAGSKDGKAFLWDIEDYQNMSVPLKKRELSSLSASECTSHVSCRSSLQLFTGKEVEEINFDPFDKNLILAVGESKECVFWDVRSGVPNVISTSNISQNNMITLDFDPKVQNQLLLGDDKGQIFLIDKRKNDSSLAEFNFKNEKEVRSVRFSRKNENFLGVICDKYHMMKIDESRNIQLMLTHFGHRMEVIDFDWNEEDLWSIITVSDETDTYFGGGGGSLHIFRPLDLLYLSKEDAINKLNEASLTRSYSAQM